MGWAHQARILPSVGCFLAEITGRYSVHFHCRECKWYPILEAQGCGMFPPDKKVLFVIISNKLRRNLAL